MRRSAPSGAYTVVGMVFRDAGRLALARLYQVSGRNLAALTRLNQSHSLFNRLDARVDLVDIAKKMTDPEGAFLSVVKEWGQSIESADRYTFGHCERVAEYAQAVAQRLGFDAIQQTTLRLEDYLHDVGKVRVPHEILNKPGRLTPDEFDIMKLHPVYGLEMLEGVEFPWDLKSIIRWHHEKLDGTGYPDRLRGDEIPLGAQVIGIADVFDAMTTTRSYREAMPREVALAELTRCRHWWRDDVLDAFMSSVGAPRVPESAPAAA